MIDKLNELATNRRVRLTLATALGLFALANLTSTLFADLTGAGILDLSGGRNIADVRPGLSPAAMHALIAGYGPVGRRDHLLITLVSDIALPIAVFSFATLALLNTLRRAGAPKRWRRIALLLPLAYLVTDWGENAGIITQLLRYPDPATAVASITGVLTAAKSAVLPLNFVVIIALTAAVALRNRRTRASGSPA